MSLTHNIKQDMLKSGSPKCNMEIPCHMLEVLSIKSWNVVLYQWENDAWNHQQKSWCCLERPDLRPYVNMSRVWCELR